jgi:hypothetical protein
MSKMFEDYNEQSSPRGHKMEQSIEALKEMMALDNETMIAMDKEISSLKHEILNLRLRLMKARRG